jgi:lipopolysaccharide export system protein LptA
MRSPQQHPDTGNCGLLRRCIGGFTRNVGCVLLAVSFACSPAHAEKADRTKPVNIEADHVDVDDAKQIATFIGNVVLTQGTLIIRGDRMIVQQDAEGFKTGIAYGDLASFRQKREGLDEYVDGFAERIEYDSKADKVQMFVRAYLKKANDDVRGNFISYDATTEFFRVIGGGKQAASAGNPEGRVRAVIQPKSKTAPDAPPAPPLPLKPAPDVANPRVTPAVPR